MSTGGRTFPRWIRAVATAAIVALALVAQVPPAGAAGATGANRARPGVTSAVYAQPFFRVRGHGAGLSPAQVQRYYRLPAGGGRGVVAVVDAYDDPTIAADLAVFKRTFDITGCSLTKVNQDGQQGNFPAADAGWALEISLDVEWVCAMAPRAHILLVEARSNAFGDLFAAEDYASAHAAYVSDSWGAYEFTGESTNDAHFAHLGVSYVVASGDSSAQEYPAASPDVLAVGGTSIATHDHGTSLGKETGWSESGGGCSAEESANPAQVTGSVQCQGKRAIPDVAFDADPASGVAVYDTSSGGPSGWYQVGGTSIGAPVWAALADDVGVMVSTAELYRLPRRLFRDITQGANVVASCLVGYDLVTGRGSPAGLP